ncbi:MAG: OmpA family protein [Gammaproteobacteria bacterium]|nr:OmpA family protein [Gammaproteobacteria bacterium]
MLICCLMLLVEVQASQRFQANFEQSRWETQTSPVRCELNHPIPRYGRGSFVYDAGGELVFTMHIQMEPPITDSVANMLSVPPFWIPGKQKELAQVGLSKGKTPFYVRRDLALRMLYELEAGMFPTLQYKDWADQQDDVLVALSSVNFREVLPEFQQCISQLLPYGLSGVQDGIVRFGSGRYALTSAAKAELEPIRLFASQFKNTKIIIEGHTDSRGHRDYNQRLSVRRSEAVSNYLISQGIAPERIITRAFGERTPASSNRFPAGRAINRRVIVSLSKTP